MSLYALPWEERGAEIYLRRDPEGNIVASINSNTERVDEHEPQTIIKTVYNWISPPKNESRTVRTVWNWYVPNLTRGVRATSFSQSGKPPFGQCSTFEEAKDKVDELLIASGCKLITKRMVSFI